MDEQCSDIKAAVRSSDPDRVNDAIERIKSMDRDERPELFDGCFGDLTSIYEASNDGYVRQSVVRVVEQLTPGLAVVVLLTEADVEEADADAMSVDPAAAGGSDVDAETLGDAVTRQGIERRLDTATGFLLEAIVDEDGRVRQSATRALKDAYRGYEALEDRETIDALATELARLADQYEGSRREHLLESKEDAEFFLRPAGGQLVAGIRDVVDQLDES